MMMPIRTEKEDEDPQTTFAVFAFDPDIRRPVDTHTLRKMDGLTEAEAKLCESLYDTKNLTETAEQLNVSSSIKVLERRALDALAQAHGVNRP